jgi:stage V sporulation protein G
MEITEVRIFPTDDEHLRALFSITIDNCFMIRGLKIIRGPKEHFIDMPSKRRKGEDRREIVSAISAEARKMLEEKVFAEYEKITGEPLNRRKLTKS